MTTEQKIIRAKVGRWSLRNSLATSVKLARWWATAGTISTASRSYTTKGLAADQPQETRAEEL